MLPNNQREIWYKVLFIMCICTLFQIPINHYASGGTVIKPTVTEEKESYSSLRMLNSVDLLTEETVNNSYRAEEQRLCVHQIEDQQDQECQQVKSIMTNQNKQLFIKRENKLKETDNLKILDIRNQAEDHIQVEWVDKMAREDIAPLPQQSRGADKEISPTNIKKVVYLTIDDGPGGASEQILDILSQYQVKATYFLLEPRVRNYQDMVKRMAQEGHMLGVHGVTHDVHRFYASAQSVVSEFNQTKESLAELTGQEYLLARTPYGSSPYLTTQQEAAIEEQGFQIWDWNVDSRDWYYRSENYVKSTIKQVENLTQKGIEPVILIHELQTTAQYLPELIEYLVTHNYEFRTLNMEAEPVRLR